MNKLIFAPLAACLAGFLAAPHLAVGLESSSVEAGTAVQLDSQGLVDGSDLIVLGRVLEAHAVESPSSPGSAARIDTEYLLEVERTYFGTDAPQRLVRLPGGVLPDGRGMLIAGVPRLAVGEDALLFLGPRANDSGMRMPVGLSQGRYRVLSSPDGVRFVRRDDAPIALLNEDGEAQLGPRHWLRPLADVSAEVQAAVVARRAREAEGETEQ